MRRKVLIPGLMSAALLAPLASAHATTCGSASYNHDINWYATSDLYYTVLGPASTCGDLWCSRNGGGYVLNASNWICTNSLGDATKGPWSSSSQTSDETSYCYIDWHSCTSPVQEHIWDITDPVATVDTGYPNSFTGTASDGTWGAGFDSSWAYCQTEMYDATPGVGVWWDFSAHSWTGTSPSYGPCTLSGMPSYNVTWSAPTSSFPTLSSGHHYYWKVLVWQGTNQGIKTVDFWY
jgi:hypothetical protein